MAKFLVKSGFKGLKDQYRPGCPSKLTYDEKQLVIELAEKSPRSIKNIQATLFELTGKSVSDSTIKRIFKAAGFCWIDTENP
jgi:transposase